MKVQIEVLRAALSKLLDHAKEARGSQSTSTPTCTGSCRRKCLVTQAHNPQRSPWARWKMTGPRSRRSETQRRSRLATDGYGLVWASVVLRAIGDRTP